MNKKGISAIVATVMLILLTVVTFIALQSWYLEFTDNLQYKSLQQLDLNEEMVKILDIRYENSIPVLYIRSRDKSYLIIEKITLNGGICNLNGGNAIYPNDLNKIGLNCQNLLNSTNRIKIFTKNDIVERLVVVNN
ncbi:MAG: hypothetical protein PF569_09840 [Candidatus Woesearchaeota archaeon]|jgi:flagellin-like protein|nr:hypothetical protein [Candidatus Woesearchaeota archaeon]